MKKNAMFYEKLGEKIHCFLCPHNCIIDKNNFGKCRVRINEDDKLYTINYGEVTSISMDPIEKKPLHYFKPSTNILSIGSFGCNFTCGFCQNHSISHVEAPSEFFSKEKLVQLILTLEDNIGIAFTYNEPSIWYEYVYEVSKLLKETSEDKSVVLVTNGYISEEPLKELLPYVDAMNIDLKSYNNDYYNKVCGGNLTPVLKTIEQAAKNCHVEVTNLLVSNEHHSIEDIESISKFLSNIDKNIPLHLSRYFPRYKMNNPATTIETMVAAEEIAKKYLNRVSLGNI
ncbi:AmmeMemoRadiSam system radical SAM enzyme [Clostridium tunisiense]|uniref:AmmeMemoRadiSam system radical SAM enzyme n=1 Tax=Clostridium tunisiense TaxID=219748 RepID=UPI00031F2C03|nr:AmmeMemoRadiSam system radical SAM enzyme [Clostridium tunisiense]